MSFGRLLNFLKTWDCLREIRNRAKSHFFLAFPILKTFYFKIKNPSLFPSTQEVCPFTLQPLTDNWNHSSPPKQPRKEIQEDKKWSRISVLQKHFKSCSGFIGWIAMNQNLYGQSEPSFLSCGFLTNNKQRCITGSIRHIRNLHRTRTGPLWCPAPVPDGSPVPAAGRFFPQRRHPCPSTVGPTLTYCSHLTETSYVAILRLRRALKLCDKPDGDTPHKRKDSS